MAVMARAVGIPARVAVGFYQADQLEDSSWEFSSHDLHAWPELYFEDYGWVRFEPTPSSHIGSVPDYTSDDIVIYEPSPGPSSPTSRPEMVRGGNDGLRQCRSRWLPDHEKKKEI